jgi:copper(I)-binding protein
MRKTTATVAGLLLSGGLLAASACSSSTETTSGATTTAKTGGTTAPSGQGITISDAWCRTSPAMTSAGACYMVISNGGSTADELTKAAVPTSIAGKTEVHETVMAGGGESSGTTMKAGDMAGGSTTTAAMGDMGGSTGSTGSTMGGMGAMQMRPVSSIEIPAGGKVELKPGGYHVMLLELAAPLQTGQKVPITLTFDQAGTKNVEAEVRAS